MRTGLERRASRVAASQLVTKPRRNGRGGGMDLIAPDLLQLDSARGSSYLKRDFASATPVGERSFGSRKSRPGVALRRVEKALQLAGITRVADISHLSPSGFPVCQATRPWPLSHALLGQNSGAQGRGATASAARISAIMEMLEDNCAEPRHAQLVRGSYEFLRRTHPILPPGMFARFESSSEPAPGEDEPLLWTWAFSMELGIDILVPAESMFYALNARDYGTRPLFLESSNGLAAGGSLVEATLHALYELVERHHLASWQAGSPELSFERIRNDDLRSLAGYRKLCEDHPGIGLCVFAMRFEVRALRLITILCVLIDAGREIYRGSRCSNDVGTALEAALAEAMQSRATQYSAAREDVSFRERPARRFEESEIQSALRDIPEVLSISALTRRTRCRRFRTLQGELRFLLDQVHRLGFTNVVVKNFTRVGLEVPVVRVAVPGMKMQAYLRPRPYTAEHVIQCQYCLDTT